MSPTAALKQAIERIERLEQEVEILRFIVGKRGFDPWMSPNEAEPYVNQSGPLIRKIIRAAEDARRKGNRRYPYQRNIHYKHVGADITNSTNPRWCINVEEWKRVRESL